MEYLVSLFHILSKYSIVFKHKKNMFFFLHNTASGIIPLEAERPRNVNPLCKPSTVVKLNPQGADSGLKKLSTHVLPHYYSTLIHPEFFSSLLVFWDNTCFQILSKLYRGWLKLICISSPSLEKLIY